jgi:hypothetical protein
VASIRSGLAIQKMISAKRGNIPAKTASRQPMRATLVPMTPVRHPPVRVSPGRGTGSIVRLPIGRSVGAALAGTSGCLDVPSNAGAVSLLGTPELARLGS